MQFQDVCIELAKKLKAGGKSLDMGEYESTEDFIKKSCVKSDVNFDQIKKDGVWVPPGSKPQYHAHAKKLDLAESGSVILDKKTGVFWDWKKSKAKSEIEAREKGYTKTKNGYKGYKGQKFDHGIFSGFKPDKVNKSGKLEIYSNFMKEKGFDPMPAWIPIPEHQNMSENELVLTTFKVNVQAHSRTQNCKWLSELFHDNPAWINTETAERLGIKDGDDIEVTQIKKPSGKSNYTQPAQKSIKTKAKVTCSVHPKVIAISHHCGHWQYGKIASGNAAATGHETEVDDKHVWWQTKGWKGRGEHPNWIIPNAPDPVSGAIRCMDTVVTVKKV